MDCTSQTGIYSWCHISLFIEFLSVLSSHAPGLGWGFLFLELHKDPVGFLNAGGQGKSLESSGHVVIAETSLTKPSSFCCSQTSGFLVTLGASVPTSLEVPQRNTSGTLLPPGAPTTLRTCCLHYLSSWRNCLLPSPSGLCILSSVPLGFAYYLPGNEHISPGYVLIRGWGRAWMRVSG